MPTLILLALACGEDAARPDPADDTATDADTDTDTDTDTDDTAAPETMPWDAPDFWTVPGPLAALVTADPEDPARTWYVRMATSADAVAWVEHDAVVVSDFNSLDLFVTDEGVILTGLVENPDFMLHAGSVYAIASADLVTWSSHEWPIPRPAAQNLVDPSLHLRWDGRLGLAYYSCSDFGVDPVWVEGDHPIRRAVWTGAGWQEDPFVAFAGEYLVDPVICPLDGTEWLFATRAAASVVTARGNGDGTFSAAESLDWANHTVPSCLPEDGALRLLGQGIGMTGIPSTARMDGETLEETGAIYAEHLWGTNNCSSPVLGRFRGEYVLFCAVNAALDRLPDLGGDTG